MTEEQFKSRTQWAERHVDEFLSRPLVSEFVYRGPQALDGNQREVADFLVTYGPPGILLSQKCQEDPTLRRGEKLDAWAHKAAKKGVSQLRGALRTGAGRPMRCQHRRRGSVDFPTGLPQVAHAVVLIEVLQPVALPGDEDFPLDYSGTPISYFSLNDFLNVAIELRTMPEIIEYLDRRRALGPDALRTIGEERSLFGFYLLNESSFAGCVGIPDAKVVLAARSRHLRDILSRKRESDRFSGLLEYAADQLATRLPDFADGLPPTMVAEFDPPNDRRNYLAMQRVLADLRLRERAEMGRAFEETITAAAAGTQNFVYRAMHLDSQPDWVYVVGSSRGFSHLTVLERLQALMHGALAYFGKSRCLAIIDRDGVSFDVGLSRAGYSPSMTDHAVGQELFGKLKMKSAALSLVP